MSCARGFAEVQGNELIHIPGARSVGQPSPNEIAEVMVCTRQADNGLDLEAFVQELGNLDIRSRQYVGLGDLDDNFGADISHLTAIESFAQDNDLTVLAVSPAHRSVRLVGSLGNLSKAFQVQFYNFQSPQGSYRGYTGSVRIPEQLAGIVNGVFNLDTRPAARPQLRVRPSSAVPLAGVGGTGKLRPFTPVEIAQLYNFPSDVDGAGQCVGIIELGGGYVLRDLNDYFQGLGIATPSIVPVSVAGGFNFPFGPSVSEVALDIEVVGAMAPGANIVVYFAPNSSMGFLRAIHAAIADRFHGPSVISISWGQAEGTWNKAILQAMNLAFQQAAKAGITVCAAAGDSGFTDGVSASVANVDFPASSPYVLACGGTRLEASGCAISAESVWNDGAQGGATGGGVSDIFEVPSYQSTVNVPPSVNPSHGTGRGVPDVAGDADPNTGYIVRVNGQDAVIGGTSAVAPLWAALIARINQKIGSPAGFVHPLLYTQGVAGGGFHDVLNGNNGPGGYQAGPGWNACTGLGTPDGTALSEAL